MRVSLKNLGAIAYAEIELKPLTVFMGDNRQGKTQTLYIATAMLGDYGQMAYI